MRHFLIALLFAAITGPAVADGIARAEYDDPTGRYDHGILGDAIEWATLKMTTDRGRRLRIELPETRVFEDIHPRLADLDGDGENEVIAIETDIARGARLSVYGPDGLIAATPYIGTTHRWLAPIGAADLDGDGKIEIAYVDRPHLARVLRVWRFEAGELVLAGDVAGFTNHRIGEDNIAGGIRDCGQGPEMILADASWSTVVAVSFDGSNFTATPIGPHVNRASFTAAIDCR